MTSRRSALGKGLGALISTPSTKNRGARQTASQGTEQAAGAPAFAQAAATAPRPEQTIVAPLELPVELIDPNPEQPRRQFDPKGLAELAASIGQHGVLQPIVVRRADDRYQLIVGERRWRASQQAGRRTIPAVIAEVAQSELSIPDVRVTSSNLPLPRLMKRRVLWYSVRSRSVKPSLLTSPAATPIPRPETSKPEPSLTSVKVPLAVWWNSWFFAVELGDALWMR